MAVQYDPFISKMLRRIGTAVIEAAAQAAADQAASEAAAEFAPQVGQIVADALEEPLAAMDFQLRKIWRHLQFRTTDGQLTTGTLICGDAFQEEPYPLDWVFGDWGAFGLILSFEEWDTAVPPEEGGYIPGSSLAERISAVESELDGVGDSVSAIQSELNGFETSMSAIIGGEA